MPMHCRSFEFITNTIQIIIIIQMLLNAMRMRRTKVRKDKKTFTSGQLYQVTAYSVGQDRYLKITIIILITMTTKTAVTTTCSKKYQYPFQRRVGQDYSISVRVHGIKSVWIYSLTNAVSPCRVWQIIHVKMNNM